jgi:hypothetical protein
MLYSFYTWNFLKSCGQIIQEPKLEFQFIFACFIGLDAHLLQLQIDCCEGSD